MVKVADDRFEEMVREALDGMPPDLTRVMRNVAITVEHDPGPPGLLGLYEGIPLTDRGQWYTGVQPDRITIYRLPILRICRTREQVVTEVTKTVVHEVGHHFGIDDERLHELGY